MTKSKHKFTEQQQEQIDEGWELFNKAMEACEEASAFLYDLGEDLSINTSRASDAAAEARDALDKVYSYGASILPKHSSDGGKK